MPPAQLLCIRLGQLLHRLRLAQRGHWRLRTNRGAHTKPARKSRGKLAIPDGTTVTKSTTARKPRTPRKALESKPDADGQSPTDTPVTVE